MSSSATNASDAQRAPKAPKGAERAVTPLVLRASIVSALGGLLFGFDTAVISGTTEQLASMWSLNGAALGFVVATALIGTMVGALFAGIPADRFGRKKVLMVIGVLYFVSALGSGLVSDPWTFMLFRFLGGIGVGGASVVAPIYTAEIAPASARGRLVGLVQFNVVFGILLAYVTNYLFAQALPADIAWRWMLGIEAVPALIFFVLLFTIPESPRWLYQRGDHAAARAVLLRLTRSEADMQEKYQEIEQAQKDDAAASKVRFFTPGHRKVILLAIAIAAFNQLSGINAILYYAPTIFRMAGAGEDASFLQSIVIGLVNLIATMAALTIIDRFGRRNLMIIGSIGYLISLGSVAFIFLSTGENFTGTTSVLVLIGIIVFIASHAFSQGSVIWVFISEIFPNRLRARGQTLGSFTHWFFAAVTSWGFPAVAGSVGGGWAFLAFFVFMGLQLVWVLKVMPETKQVPLEQMSDKLGLPKEEVLKD